MSVTDKLKESLSKLNSFQSIVEEQVAADNSATQAGLDAAARMKQIRDDATKLLRFYAIVECAYLLASADGSVSDDEQKKIADNISAATNGGVKSDQVKGMLDICAESVAKLGRDKRLAYVAEALKGEEREAAFMIGAAAAWTGGGVGAKEGLAMQAMARAFGWEIPFMHKLLGKAHG